MKNFEEKIVAAHLNKMKLSSTQDINNWYRRFRGGLYNVKGLKDVVKIISNFKDKFVYIFGDYDTDGTMATAILFLTLKRLGFKNVKFRIPHRFTEGFGVNLTMLNEITEDPKDVVIITVDNGVAAIDVVSEAKSRGYTVIITDHHQPVVVDNAIILPEADVIIDPNAIDGSADFNGYCGAGLAYKLAQELFRKENVNELMPSLSEEEKVVVSGFVHKLLPLAAIATVCDQMDLKEENYVFVREGLKMLNKGAALPGMLILGEVLGISYWTEDKFGFNAGPCINALERMKNGASQFAVALMANGSRDRCIKIAEVMRKCNEKRKLAVEYGWQKAMEAIQSRGSDAGYPIIEYIPRLDDIELEKLEGYIGNIVGRVTEQMKRPCGLFTDSTEEILKGSFRSIEGYDIKAHLDECQDEFVKYGGHAMAAGASVRKDNFEHMRAAMQNCSKMPVEANNTETTEYQYDVAIKDSDIKEAIELDQRFAPFGNANEPLIYKIEGFNVIYDKDEIKRQIKGGGVRLKSIYSTAVGFGMWDLAKDITQPCELTLYGKISYNHFNNSATPQIELVGLEVNQTASSKVSKLQQMLAEASTSRNN